MLLKLLESATRTVEDRDESLDIRAELLVLLRNLAVVNTKRDAKRILALKGINQVH